MSRRWAVRGAQRLRSLRPDWSDLERRTTEVSTGARENLELARELESMVSALGSTLTELAERRLAEQKPR